MASLTTLQERCFTKGDLSRSITAKLTNPDDTTKDLSSATDVDFLMYDAQTNEIKVDYKAGVFVDKSNGQVKYDWSAEDIDRVGTYLAKFRITEGGNYEHYPVGDRLIVKIEPAKKPVVF